jgi:hypothetical protein
MARLPGSWPRRCVYWWTALVSVAQLCGGSAIAEAREPSSRLFALSHVRGAQVAEATDGSVLIASSNVGDGGRVVRQGLDGSATTVDRFGRPNSFLTTGSVGLLAAVDGSVLVADAWNERIRRLSPGGAVSPVAGSGRSGFSGDGGPATEADISLGSHYHGAGLSHTAGGELLFTDVGNNRIRLVRSDGTIITVAGSGPEGLGTQTNFAGDGGPAIDARLAYPQDVLAAPDGGFYIADTNNARVRHVRPDGTIVTFAGTDDRYSSKGDGGPATRASLGEPFSLATLPDGALAISALAPSGDSRVRRVDPHGTISTLLDLNPVTRDGRRHGDFAGRIALARGLTTTAEGGLLIATGRKVYYLAPPHTVWTLVALRDARVSERRVAVDIDATQAGRARLEVRRRTRVIARSRRAIGPGRNTLRVNGRFAAAAHEVRVTVVGAGGATASDQVSLYPTRSVSALRPRVRAMVPRLGELIDDTVTYTSGCRRFSPRRLDCALVDRSRPGSCDHVFAFLLARSGALFVRDYDCAGTGRSAFYRRPRWIGPAVHPAQWPFGAWP